MATPLMTAFVKIRPDMTGFKSETQAGVATAGKGTEAAAKKAGSRFGSAFKKYSNLALLGLGAGAFVAVKKTLGDARALGLAALQVAVKNAGAQWGTFNRQLGPVQKRMEGLGFTNSDVNHGLERLITSTDNVQLSMKAMATAADYARFKHISLEAASIALGRAAVGNTRALKDVGIATSDLPKHFSTTGTASSRLNTVMGLLNKKLGGESQKYASTYGGKLDILRAKTTDLSAKFGTTLLPILSAVAGILVKVAGNTAGVYALVTAVGLLAGAFVGLKVAALLSIESTKGALISSGIGALLVGIGIAAVLIITHWKSISKVASQVWGHVFSVIHGVWSWIMRNWPLLLTVLGGPIGAAAALIIKHWGQIRNVLVGGARAVRNTLLATWRVISAVTRAIWNGISAFFRAWWRAEHAIFAAAWNLIRNGLAGAWRAMAGTARSVWNNLRGWFGGWWRGFRTFTTNAVNGVARTLTRAWQAMRNAAVTAFQSMLRGIARVWAGIKNTVRTPVNWVITHVINGLIGAFDWVSGKVGGPHINKLRGLAQGGRLPGYGGGDRHPALLEAGEAVVPKDKARRRDFTGWASAMGIPGYARGGKVLGQNAPPAVTGRFGPQPSGGMTGGGILGGIGHAIGSVFHVAGDLAKITAAVFSGNTKALTNALADMIPKGVGGAVGDMAGLLTAIPKALLKAAVKALIGAGAASGSGADIVRYAQSFLGKIPYVWGGTRVPGGADCSGFTQAVYKHFGINAPRTSEAQGAWVRKGRPQSGGLAFYHSAPGGADPGHVAIVKNAATVISQGGGMGPKLMAIRGMPLLFTGTPPGGFGGAAGGTLREQQLTALWTAAGGPGGLRGHMAAAIAMAESGGRAVKQAGQPWATTGWGYWQITPGNPGLLNGPANARAAVGKYRGAGDQFTPWTTYTSGAYRKFMAAGGLITEPVAGVGLRSGRPYAFGERGVERVTPGAGAASTAADMGTLIREVRRLQDITAQQGRDFADVLNGVARRAR